MDILKRIVIFVIVLVVGIFLVAYVVPPFVLSLLDRPDLASWTGFEPFVKAVPFVLILFLTVGALLILFPEVREQVFRQSTPRPGYRERRKVLNLVKLIKKK